MIILSPLPIGENKSLTLSPLQPSGVERDPWMCSNRAHSGPALIHVFTNSSWVRNSQRSYVVILHHNPFIVFSPSPSRSQIMKLPLACSLLCWTILRPWRWRRYVPPKRRVPLNALDGVISQKKILFKQRIIWLRFRGFV
jgi:hypothetical protein